MNPIQNVMDKLLVQYEQKDKAYGYAANTSFRQFGKQSYIIRLYDKAKRLSTLRQHPDIPEADESIKDTMGDAVTYCFMAIGSSVADKILPIDNNGELAHNLSRSVMNYVYNNIDDFTGEGFTKFNENTVLSLGKTATFEADCLWLALGLLNEIVNTCVWQ